MKKLNTINDQIRNFLVENFIFDNDKVALKDEDSFIENGVIDSTGILELTSFVEETYNIVIRDEEMVPENLDSINALVTFIQAKQGEKTDVPPDETLSRT
jgi:acyl carrier protein